MFFKVHFNQGVGTPSSQKIPRLNSEAHNKTLEYIIKQFKQIPMDNNQHLFHPLVDQYIPLSQFDIEALRKSPTTVVKSYKESVYFGEMVQQKRQGIGIMIYHNERVYEGEWSNNQKHGKGFEKFSHEGRYSGEYREGKPEGYGVYLWANGEEYDGEWKQGHKHGRGTWKGSGGDYYQGEWRLGKVDGEGTHVWLNGDRYQGQWKECLKHGLGREEFANGDLYVGSYVKGKPSGYGEYYWKNGSSFKGSFRDGLRHGKGIWVKGGESLEKYEGMYANDKKCGYGVFTWANGNSYKGSYFDDNRHGYGEMYWKDRCCYKGHWENGTQVEESILLANLDKTVILQEETVSEDLEQKTEQLCSKTHISDRKNSKGPDKMKFNKTATNFKNITKEDIINTSKLNNFLLEKYQEAKSNQPKSKQVKRRKLKTQTSTEWFSHKAKQRPSNHSSISNTRKLKTTHNISELINTFSVPHRKKSASSKTQLKGNATHSTFDLAKSLENHVHCQQQPNYQGNPKTKIPHSSFYLYRIATSKARPLNDSKISGELHEKRSTELKPSSEIKNTKKQFRRSNLREQLQSVNVDKTYHSRQYSFSMKH